MFLERLLDSGLPEEIIALIISALPVFELRASIPVLINVFHFPWYYALPLAVAGTMLPTPFLLLFFNTLYRWLAKKGILKKPLQWFINHVQRRGAFVEKYGQAGLLLFVAIPLPVTGAWTGSLIAALLGLRPLPAFLAILAGVIIAGIIVTCLSLLGWTGAIIAGLGLISIAVYSLVKTRDK